MTLTDFQATSTEMKEILGRLAPYLPENLKTIDTTPQLSFTFAPFTGREQRPAMPSTHDDPKLSYVSEPDDPGEHRIREAARRILFEMYHQAREAWDDAAYIASLKKAAASAGALWTNYEQALEDLSLRYEYLRDPNAAAEWRSALSRLIDAQDSAMVTAVAFDECAEKIANARRRHPYTAMERDAALVAAGYPDAKDWHIAYTGEYGERRFVDLAARPPLEERVRRLVDEQDAHVLKISRLTGAVS
ncbi:hypothetical protein [Streptomyces ramulosus]|uniref:hypothetical protein n=1 Tax=Streptomyces TaxID=1883 RepID=UPI0031E6585E